MTANKKMSMREKPNYMPLGVVEIILSKLPLKDVLRFKAVSKSWRATILNPRFARIHINNACYHSDDYANQLLMWPSHHHTGFCYLLGRFDGSGFQVISHLQCPLKKPHQSPLCSCDGFFLIYDKTSNMCLLWNPITQSRTSFAYPETMIGPYHTTHGICYDSWEDDYKVILVCRWLSMIYTVFSCRNGSWTETKQFPYKDIERAPGVSVRGVPYWNSYLHHRSCIVYFDAKECEFKTLDKPDEVIGSGTDSTTTFLTNLNGRLCLCRRYNAYMDIWVLVEEDKSWTRVPAWPPLPCAIKIAESGTIYSLFVQGPKQPYILFFVEKKLDAPSIRYNGTSPSVVALRGSLAVLPPRQTDYASVFN